MSDSGPALEGDVVRLARPDEVALLPEIERRAGERFREVGLDEVADGEPLAPEQLERARESGRLWVAVHDDVVVGFALVAEVDGCSHLLEVSVLPEHAGRRLGARLVRTALFDALRRGSPALTLFTFADVPWNAPYYERLGFEPFEPTTPGLLGLREQERRLGLPIERRVAMRRDLGPKALRPWGFTTYFERQLAEADQGQAPARVILESRGQHTVVTAAGEIAARVAGRLKRSRSDLDQPAIGDWVLVSLPRKPGEDARIEHVLRRRTSFERKVAGARTDVQVVAANVDRVLVVMGLDGDYSLRRLERFPLDMLHRLGLKATFFIPGWVVETHTAVCRRIVEAGHEVGYHGYLHEPSLFVEQERERIRKVRRIMKNLLGTEPLGHRSPEAEGDPALMPLLAEEGFVYSSNLMDRDRPYLHDTGHSPLVELPTSWLYDDSAHFFFTLQEPARRPIAPASTVREIWWEEFLGLKEEGGCLVLMLHPQIIGRVSRVRMLEDLLAAMLASEDVLVGPALEISRAALPGLLSERESYRKR